MALTLNPKSVRELPGPDGARPYLIHYDAELPGFGLRVTKAGARAFVLNYRARGVERRITLDSVPSTATLDQTRRILSDARAQAAKIKSGAKYDGRDPMALRHGEREAPTVADLSDRYIEEYLPKKRPSSQSEDRSMIANYVLPALRNKRVADVQYADIDGLHRKITKAGAAIRANRVVSLLSKMFALAIRWHMRTDNPAQGIERNPEERRQRYLTAVELSRLSTALSNWQIKSSANAIRLLLLTGARRGEVLGATWDQFDLTEGVWTKPSAHTKQKKEHRAPISAPARQLLSEMLQEAKRHAKGSKKPVSEYVFPTADGDAPQQALKRSWASICKEAKLSGVRVHDLRHTYASVLASAGMSLPVIGQLLGHTNPNTTARYAHLFDDPLRKATETAGAILADSKTADVIEIGGRR
jgi:integrase